jgi:hypothetical protein
LTGNAVAVAVKVIVDPLGARSGTRLHATVMPAAAASRQRHNR